MSGFGACFSPYMLISSTLQTVFSKERREIQDETIRLNEEFQLAMRDAKEEFQDALEGSKQEIMRKKLEISKTYRAKEKFKSLELKHASIELKTFFERCLPIDTNAVPVLEDVAKIYMSKGYSVDCPINVILLHTLQAAINYNEIGDALEKTQPELGNIVYQRWCNKDVAHNSAILNLHAIMANIPTLVISPYFQGGKIHFNAAMWEAQADTKPLIRPLFSINCNTKYLKTPEGKNDMQKKLFYISTIISGCARDSYMLFSLGLSPTLPKYLQKRENTPLLQFLEQKENENIKEFMLAEYTSAAKLLSTNYCPSKILDVSEMQLLEDSAKIASNEINRLFNQKIIK